MSNDMQATQGSDTKQKPIHISGEAEFNRVINEELVLVDFWAGWCNPCRMIAPVLEELADEWSGKVKIAKLNIEDDPSHQVIAMNYGVMGIPNLILFSKGKPVDRIVGAAPKPMFVEFLNRNYEKYQEGLNVDSGQKQEKTT